MISFWYLVLVILFPVSDSHTFDIRVHTYSFHFTFSQFFYSHERFGCVTTHILWTECGIVCSDADPGRYSQACSSSIEPRFERGHYPTGACTMVPFPPPSASEKQTHTLRDQSGTRNECACAKVAPSLSRHNWNPNVVAPEPVSVRWERLYWFELKMPFRAAAQQVSQRQTGRDISSGTVWDSNSQTAYVNKLVNTSVFFGRCRYREP